MKAIFSIKSLIVLTIVALGLSLGASPSQAEFLGSDAEIVIRTTGDEATFNYTYIDLQNWKHQDSIYGLPQRNDVIAKGDSVTLNNTHNDGLVSVSFTREDDGKIRIDFPSGILSKRNPDDGCDGGLIAQGCGPADQGEVFGVGFLGKVQERIYSEVPAYFKAQEMKIFFRTDAGEELIPLEEDGSSSYVLYSGSKVKIKVEAYGGPQIPMPNNNLTDNVTLTELDGNDFVQVKMAYNLDDPINVSMDQSDQQLTVFYKENGVEKSETYPLDGGHEFRVYGPQQSHVRALATVPFTDSFALEAESDSSAFTKVEYWTTGNNPQLKGTFNLGKVTKVLYHCYSGSFSYVNAPNQVNQGGLNGLTQSFSTKMDIGTKLILKQEGPFLAIRTVEPTYEKEDSKIGDFLGQGNGGGDPLPEADLDQAEPGIGGWDPVDPQDFGDIKVDSAAIGGGGCSLSVAETNSLMNLWGLLALALPLAINKMRRK